MLTFVPALRRLEGSDDMQAYLDFLAQLDAEAPYMHYRIGERSMTVQGMKSRIRKQEKQGNAFVLLGLGLDGLPIAYFSVNGGNSYATRHSATVAVGVLQKYRGQGLALDLFDLACRMAKSQGVFRFECTVVSENIPAVEFYKRVGFSVVGTLTQRFFNRDGRLLDEFVLERVQQ